MNAKQLIEASFAARAAGDSDKAIQLMQAAMRKPDADKALADRYAMKPR